MSTIIAFGLVSFIVYAFGYGIGMACRIFGLAVKSPENAAAPKAPPPPPNQPKLGEK